MTDWFRVLFSIRDENKDTYWDSVTFKWVQESYFVQTLTIEVGHYCSCVFETLVAGVPRDVQVNSKRENQKCKKKKK